MIEYIILSIVIIGVIGTSLYLSLDELKMEKDKFFNKKKKNKRR